MLGRLAALNKMGELLAFLSLFLLFSPVFQAFCIFYLASLSVTLLSPLRWLEQERLVR